MITITICTWQKHVFHKDTLNIHLSNNSKQSWVIWGKHSGLLHLGGAQKLQEQFRVLKRLRSQDLFSQKHLEFPSCNFILGPCSSNTECFRSLPYSRVLFNCWNPNPPIHVCSPTSGILSNSFKIQLKLCWALKGWGSRYEGDWGIVVTHNWATCVALGTNAKKNFPWGVLV